MLRSTALISSSDAPFTVSMVLVLEGWFRSFVGIVLFPSSSIREYGDSIAAARRAVANKKHQRKPQRKASPKRNVSAERLDEISL